MANLAEPAARLDETQRNRAPRSEKYRFDWMGIPIRAKEPGALVAVPQKVYTDVDSRSEALNRWRKIETRVLGVLNGNRPSPQERRARFLEMSRSGELQHAALTLITVVEEIRTDYPARDLPYAIGKLLSLDDEPAVFGAVLGMAGSNLRRSRAAVFAAEWQEVEEKHFNQLFAEIVAPTALRMSAILAGAVSGVGAVAVGARISGVIVEAVLNLEEFLDLIADPKTGDDEAIAALVGLFPLLSSRLELARGGFLVGWGLVQALIAGVELWRLRMQHALAAHQMNVCGQSFEDDTAVAIPLDMLA